MDEYSENHFKAWLIREYSWRDTVHRKKVEVAIRDLLEVQPELIELNFSWPEIRKKALQRLGILI